MKLRKTLQAAALGLVQATTSVPTTVAAVGGFLGMSFATSAEAADNYGTIAQVVVKPEHIAVVQWLSKNGNPSIVQDNVFSSVGKWTESNIKRAIENTSLDAIPGYAGIKLKDIASVKVERNYEGICDTNGQRKRGQYLPTPRHPNVVNLSFLAGPRGQTWSVHGSNYTPGGSRKDPGDGSCAPKPDAFN